MGSLRHSTIQLPTLKVNYTYDVRKGFRLLYNTAHGPKGGAYLHCKTVRLSHFIKWLTSLKLMHITVEVVIFFSDQIPQST